MLRWVRLGGEFGTPSSHVEALTPVVVCDDGIFKGVMKGPDPVGLVRRGPIRTTQMGRPGEGR